MTNGLYFLIGYGAVAGVCFCIFLPLIHQASEDRIDEFGHPVLYTLCLLGQAFIYGLTWPVILTQLIAFALRRK